MIGDDPPFGFETRRCGSRHLPRDIRYLPVQNRRDMNRMKLIESVKMLVVATCAVTGQTSAQGSDFQSTLDGVFTEEQAKRGAEVSKTVCAECHEPDEFTGSFLDSWTGAPVSMLLEDITSLMPEDRPGTLRPQQYSDVLAYIFQLNGIPAGTRELATDPSLLASILIERKQ